MIDTVRIGLLGLGGWQQAPSSSWTFSSGRKLVQEGIEGASVETSYRMFQHEASGLRVGGGEESPRWVEVSLPRLVYGSNGILLKESDCAVAAERVQELVSQCVSRPQFLELSRVDLVGQFSGDLRQWNEAFRRVPHQRIRRTGLEFFDSGLVWPGKHLHVRLYDKGLEQLGRRSNCVRLEFQTRGKLVPHSVLNADRLKIDYHKAYESFRKLCLGFSPKVVPIIGKIADLLAWCNACGFQNDGMTPTELYLRSLSHRQQRRLRAQLSLVELRHFRIDWDSLVPESAPPSFVDFEEAA